MAQRLSNQNALKRAIKDALEETLRDHRGVLREVFIEALEDFALGAAIREGKKSPRATRSEVFRVAGRAMKVAFRKSFLRDLKKIKDRSILKRIGEAIENAERASKFEEIAQIKKLAGSESLYRIRAGEYRIGIAISGDQLDFVRCLRRRDLYRFFP